MTLQNITRTIEHKTVLNRAAIWLWLSIVAAVSGSVPALLAGHTPKSVVDMALPTNPVHILDLGFFLPMVIGTGVLLLKRKPVAYTLAMSFIVFLILTSVPILLTPVVQAARGEIAAWGVVVPIGILTVVLLGMLGWLLSTMRLTSTPTLNGDGQIS